MSDAGSALVVNEKKTQKTGGCVGIFFQLFDWKKRFAKKKLFSNKLLSLDSAQHGSKKFGVDDKLPKLRLMSNEKNSDPGQKHAMRTPTLVARLMGLDSLPAVQRDKIKKINSEKIEVDKSGKFASDCCQFNGHQIKLENEGSKHELKPHKLQKTGSSERRAMAKFGAERLHFKNVLSRSNKHHHPNLAPPVKSHKRLSKRNAARLIGAATRILEPGMQARNKAKCALPYSSPKHYIPADGLLVEADTGLSKDQGEISTYYENAIRFSRSKSSCRNCGNVVDIPESGTSLEQQPFVSEHVDLHLSGSERCTQRLPMSSLGTEKEIVSHRSPKKFTVFSVQSPGNVKPGAKHNLERGTLHKGSQIRWQPSQQYKKEEISTSSICYKQRFCVRNQGAIGKDRTSPRRTDTVHLNKDVPRSQSTIDHKCSKVPAKLDECRYVSKRRSTDRLYDPLSSARKRRSVDVARQDDICSSVDSTIDKQRNINCSVFGQTMVRGDIQSAKLTCISSNLARLGKINKTSDTNDGVVSFTFNSSKKHKDQMPAKTNDRGSQSERTCSNSSQNSSVLDKINRYEQVCLQKSSPSTVDTLGVLEEKLKEIRSQSDNEMALGGYPLKRTPAMILQELISALTAERSFNVNDVISGPTETCVSSCCEHAVSAHPSFQAQQKKEAAQVRHLYVSTSNNMSPLSVLEASISSGSFLFNSLNDGLVHKQQTGFKDLSHNEQQELESGVDLLHGTTSISIGRPGIELMAHFFDSISDVLCSMNLVDSRLKGTKLAHAKEVILNAELVFGNPFPHNSYESKGFSICQFIVNELETLGSVLWTNFSHFSESEDTEGNLLKGFLFDCVIEYLDSRYNISSIKGRINLWTDLPLSMNTEILIREVVAEIRTWTSWAGFVLDEQIEREMSNWTDFDVEAFETSVAIDGDILHSLVDEIVIELWQSKLN